MKKVSELEGAKLDYWVAKALNWGEREGTWWSENIPLYRCRGTIAELSPSRTWAACGPLIQECKVEIVPWNEEAPFIACVASCDKQRCDQVGESPLEAACRAIVASVYGEEVPDET